MNPELTKYAYSLNGVAELLNRPYKTLFGHTQKQPGEKRFLRFFRISESGIRIRNVDLAAYINRVYWQAEAKAPLFNVPDNFPLTVKQVAELWECDKETIWKNLDRKPWETLYLKGEKSSQTNYIIRYGDLKDFESRNYICELEAAA
ncbi:hypothetical protein [Adhaeribacter aquaticus]|uniref:hypothetical protein n=1 Tax=Adhaeribacter aquaticus TaxID=299567 RepID=UPI0003FF6684|nr:hypothetical protein [Adhaeribacter aquaticus]